jgi:hypothetical protein
MGLVESTATEAARQVTADLLDGLSRAVVKNH